MKSKASKARGRARTQGRLTDLALGLHPIAEENAIDRLAALAQRRGVDAKRIHTAEQAQNPIERLVALMVSFVPASEIRRAIVG